ncbi:hypothetical protein Tco_1334915 [Tanacetum coccineum]
MRDKNPIRTLGDYSKPSHGGYRNTIELPEGNNVVPLRSDTIRLVQNGCSFHGLRSEDPNQHLKDFLKLMDSLDLDIANRERTCMRTVKLSNNILMFQQRQGESLSEAWTRFKDLLPKVPHHGIDLWLQSNLEGLMSNFMASQEARLSKFEADFKQQQSEMTYKIDIVLKVITDRITRALPSDTSVRSEETAYKMPHKIEQYNSLSNLEKENTKSVYLRNEEDKKRGVDYVMSKILGFYKECLELGPEYLTGLEDEGEVTKDV